MTSRQTKTLILISLFLVGCGGDTLTESSGSSPMVETPWQRVKSDALIGVAMPSAFDQPQLLSNATLGWEDGVNVSRDGLHLYATYIPADFLSFVLNGDTVNQLQHYSRGPQYDMDLVSNPSGESYPWLHSDIIYSTRSSTLDEFPPWNISSLKRSVYSEGGLSVLFADENTIDMAVFTSNDEISAQNNLKIINASSANPSGIGELITAIDAQGTESINTNFVEDNPHIERIDDNALVLFFDSDDRPGGAGAHDIWYAESADNGTSWSTPQNVSTINTAGKEHQPHLFFDGNDWWLYFSTHHSDGKLAIFRSQRQGAGWDAWGTPQVVLTAGNTSGIGEPTLTSNGDLYFVTIYENPDGSYYDRYDADAWFARARGN